MNILSKGGGRGGEGMDMGVEVGRNEKRGEKARRKMVGK